MTSGNHYSLCQTERNNIFECDNYCLSGIKSCFFFFRSDDIENDRLIEFVSTTWKSEQNLRMTVTLNSTGIYFQVLLKNL